MSDALTAALAARQPGYSYIVEPADGGGFICCAAWPGISWMWGWYHSTPDGAVIAMNHLLETVEKPQENAFCGKGSL